MNSTTRPASACTALAFTLTVHVYSEDSVDSIMFASHTLQAFIMNSDEGREARRRRERSRERRAAESSEQREARLARLRERRAAECSEQREVRLDKGSQASKNAGESVILLKLLNTVSMAPSNIQLDMPSSKWIT